nr:MAG TPA: hypothetical protein [Caudoviricetes sp.]
MALASVSLIEVLEKSSQFSPIFTPFSSRSSLIDHLIGSIFTLPQLFFSFS